jgi:hypothetical protein|tara:strand:- start:1286 stop:1450 length:165 start_codon:yes stop_codon:yes gene_type:complete
MSYFRVKLGYDNQWFVLSQPKLNAKNKQDLFKILKEEFALSRVYIRRNSVICVE